MGGRGLRGDRDTETPGAFEQMPDAQYQDERSVCAKNEIHRNNYCVVVVVWQKGGRRAAPPCKVLPTGTIEHLHPVVTTVHWMYS